MKEIYRGQYAISTKNKLRENLWSEMLKGEYSFGGYLRGAGGYFLQVILESCRGIIGGASR